MTIMTNTIAAATRGETHDTPPKSGGVQRPLNTLTPPPLQMKHAPGWLFDISDDLDSGHGACVVFDTMQPDFGLSFETDVFEDGTTSNTITPTGRTDLPDWTPDALADLATATERLQVWLDDCATALQWTIDHAKEIAAQLQ